MLIQLFYLVRIFRRFVAQFFLRPQPVEHTEKPKYDEAVICFISHPVKELECPLKKICYRLEEWSRTHNNQILWNKESNLFLQDNR